jgi:DNA-directed RNA polymerase specialized sigma54-like protein
MQTIKNPLINQVHKDAVQFIKQKEIRLNWFIDAIRQRQGRFCGMNAIMHYQNEDFIGGDETDGNQ